MMGQGNRRRPRSRGRRGPELMLSLRTAGFLVRRLWRPALYIAGARIMRQR